MKKALLFLVFLSLAALEAQEVQKPVIYQSRPSFYHDTPQGLSLLHI